VLVPHHVLKFQKVDKRVGVFIHITVHVKVVPDQLLEMKIVDTSIGLVIHSVQNSSLLVNIAVRIHVVNIKKVDKSIGLVIQYSVHNRVVTMAAMGVTHTYHSHQMTQKAKETWRL
jgi:hypothetical protein